MRPLVATLDRYLLVHVGGTLAWVFGIVISLLAFEHAPRLFDIARLSGRKSYIILQSMIALSPEYGAVGLLFGLYLAIALTVRRLSLHGEIDVLEATGVPPRRWMRAPALVAVLVAGLLLLIQGWLMPAGERRLVELGRQMERGSFGYALESGDFIDLGKSTVRFDRLDGRTGELVGVFIHAGDTTFTAKRGRLAFNSEGDVLVDLTDGRSINGHDGQSLSFSRFHFDSGRRKGSGAESPTGAERRNRTALPALLRSGETGDRAAAWSRLLWPVFALMVPFLAQVLGKPARRTISSPGLMAGLVLLVLFIRTAGIVATTRIGHPGLLAAAVGIAWAVAAGLLIRGERAWGEGYADAALRRLAIRLAKRRRRTCPDNSNPENRTLSRRQEQPAMPGKGTLASQAPELVSA